MSTSNPGCCWHTETSPCSSTSQIDIGSGAVNTYSSTTRWSGNSLGSVRRCIHHISVGGSRSCGEGAPKNHSVGQPPKASVTRPTPGPAGGSRDPDPLAAEG